MNELFTNNGASEFVSNRKHKHVREMDQRVESVNQLLKESKSHNTVVTWEQYRRDKNARTGNPLIDDYGKNDPNNPGEGGKGVVLEGEALAEASRLIEKYNLNVYASDRIPLNRMVPDARFPG